MCFSFFGSVDACSSFDAFGPFVLMIRFMLWDILKWALLQLAANVAFGVALGSDGSPRRIRATCAGISALGSRGVGNASVKARNNMTRTVYLL